jgi:glycosyltransferase involved in cell wall biosynthesis
VVPSARFRARQYIGPLASFGIDMQEQWSRLGAYPPLNRGLRPAWLVGTLAQRLPQLVGSWRADVVLLQRELVSTLPTIEALTPRPRIVDVDDALHLHRSGRAARYLASLADIVVVGNAWLAEVWRPWNPAVEILPTGVDTERYTASPLPEALTIGWIGLSANLHYLAAIAPALSRVLSRFPGTKIAVCCDRRPNIPGLPLTYVPWSPAIEVPFLSSIAVGIMPLTDGPWERGKCSFKMLQYMAAGRPCIVSPVGMNNEILQQAEVGRAARTIDDWIEGISSLLSDRSAAEQMGAAGRDLAVARYSVRVLAPRFAEVLRRLARGSLRSSFARCATAGFSTGAALTGCARLSIAGVRSGRALLLGKQYSV